MSSMELFYGTYRPVTIDFVLDDSDARYDREDADGVKYVSVDGQVYAVRAIADLDPDGFTYADGATASGDPRVLCYWYNGGAGLHEVLEHAIRDAVTGDKRRDSELPRIVSPHDHDAAGNRYPGNMVGWAFRHASTGKEYRVMDVSLDADRAIWMVTYVRMIDTGEFPTRFSRALSEFMRPGRFTRLT